MGSLTSDEDDAVHTHVFASGALALPSMAIEIGMPEVPSFGMNFGVRANAMRIQLQRSGLLNATMSLVAQGETRAVSSAAGSPSEAVIERFSQFMGEVKRNGTALGLPKPKTPITGPGGIQAAFAWQAAKDPVEGRTCTVELVNDVATY